MNRVFSLSWRQKFGFLVAATLIGLVLVALAAHTVPVVAAALVAIVVAAGSLTRIGSEFMPKLDEGSILINTRRLPSISLDEANRLSTEAAAPVGLT